MQGPVTWMTGPESINFWQDRAFRLVKARFAIS